MGKLVPQDPNDEPASELLKKIATEKERLVKEKKIKKQKLLPPINEEEKPFELPKGWISIRFGEVINLISGQHLKPHEYSEVYEKGMIPYLTGPAEFGEKYPIPTRFTFARRAISLPGNLLLTCKGSGVGKLNESDVEIAISRQLMATQPILLSTSFTNLLAMSLNDHLRSSIVGIAIPGISRENVTDAIVALPPLKEQHRIITKVTQLIELCDALKAQITNSQTTQLQFTNTIVEQAII